MSRRRKKETDWIDAYFAYAVGDSVRVVGDYVTNKNIKARGCDVQDWIGLVGVVVDRFMDHLTPIVRIQLPDNRVLTLLGSAVIKEN